MSRRQRDIYQNILDSVRHDGNTKRTDKALKILQQIQTENQKKEHQVSSAYVKVNDESEESTDEDQQPTKDTKEKDGYSSSLSMLPPLPNTNKEYQN